MTSARTMEKSEGKQGGAAGKNKRQGTKVEREEWLSLIVLVYGSKAYYRGTASTLESGFKVI